MLTTCTSVKFVLLIGERKVQICGIYAAFRCGRMVWTNPEMLTRLPRAAKQFIRSKQLVVARRRNRMLSILLCLQMRRLNSVKVFCNGLDNPIQIYNLCVVSFFSLKAISLHQICRIHQSIHDKGFILHYHQGQSKHALAG